MLDVHTIDSHICDWMFFWGRVPAGFSHFKLTMNQIMLHIATNRLRIITQHCNSSQLYDVFWCTSSLFLLYGSKHRSYKRFQLQHTRKRNRLYMLSTNQHIEKVCKWFKKVKHLASFSSLKKESKHMGWPETQLQIIL